MAKKWEKWIQKDRSSKLVGGFLMLAIAFLFLHHRLTQDVVRTKDDLKDNLIIFALLGEQGDIEVMIFGFFIIPSYIELTLIF